MYWPTYPLNLIGWASPLQLIKWCRCNNIICIKSLLFPHHPLKKVYAPPYVALHTPMCLHVLHYVPLTCSLNLIIPIRWCRCNNFISIKSWLFLHHPLKKVHVPPMWLCLPLCTPYAPICTPTFPLNLISWGSPPQPINEADAIILFFHKKFPTTLLRKCV